jgi:hypothetical protein
MKILWFVLGMLSGIVPLASILFYAIITVGKDEMSVDRRFSKLL